MQVVIILLLKVVFVTVCCCCKLAVPVPFPYAQVVKFVICLFCGMTILHVVGLTPPVAAVIGTFFSHGTALRPLFISDLHVCYWDMCSNHVGGDRCGD